jgi:hypothetical protein
MDINAQLSRLHTSTVRYNWTIIFHYVAFAAMLFGIKLWLIHSYGNATPFWDQWDAEAEYLYKPFLAGTLSLADLFSPHNEHRIFTTRLLALAELSLNGVWNPLLQMVANAGLHIIALLFFIVLLVRVIGRNHLPALLGFALILFGIPYAYDNTLAGFQSQFYFVLLFSIACLWFTITRNPLTAYWWGGVACGMLAFLSLASGIFAYAASAAVGFIFYLTGLRRTHKQFIAVAILAGLFIICAVLTPTLARHGPLKATSISQFYNSLMAALSWPISSSFFSALILNSPAIAFVGAALRKRLPASNHKWFLIGLVVWVLGQAMSIAYGRAVDSLASRYLDLFAIAVLVNYVCLISIAQGHAEKRRGWVLFIVSFWIVAVFIFLGIRGARDIREALTYKLETSIKQELNTSNYLATGDFKHLQGKPQMDVPYPDPVRLASILKSSDILAILPTNLIRLTAPVSIASKPDNAFVVDGYGSGTPKRLDRTLGSYGAQGKATTGQLSIRYENNMGSSMLKIPVAGYPLSDGINIVIEQNGHLSPLIVESNPKESWRMAYVKVSGGPFSIRLTDSSATAWVAIGAPSIAGRTGRLDALNNALLTNYIFFLMFGVVVELLMLIANGMARHASEFEKQR